MYFLVLNEVELLLKVSHSPHAKAVLGVDFLMAKEVRTLAKVSSTFIAAEGRSRVNLLVLSKVGVVVKKLSTLLHSNGVLQCELSVLHERRAATEGFATQLHS